MPSADSGGIVWFATQGGDHLDARRMESLLGPLGARMVPFERSGRLGSSWRLLRELRAARPQLVVMEGTGIAGGAVLLLAEAVLGIPYVVSSGDAVGPYLRLRSRAVGVLGSLYERLLCSRCAGYIGWTPYLAGRALTLGAPRAMTAAGWSSLPAAAEGARAAVRERLGIADGAVVFGIAGSLNWNERHGYCYGAELVRAAARTAREDLVVVVLGDGPGRERLQEIAGAALGSRVLLPGRVPHEQVADHLAALDVASLPQSVDGVGSFRYSIKLSEYLAAGLPVVTSHIPAAYDLDDGFLWRLPGAGPWSEEYVAAMSELMDGVGREEISRRGAAAAARSGEPFDEASQRLRVQAFLEDLLGAQAEAARRA